MTAVDRPLLTPSLALSYLRELSIDVGAAAVIDAAGRALAGDPELAARAHELLAGAAAEEAVAAPAPGGTMLAIRAPGGLAIAVAASPRALPALLEHDVRTALADLAEAP